jgi:ferredoxin
MLEGAFPVRGSSILPFRMVVARVRIARSEANMKVGVDLTRCHGHARCWAIDSSFFTLDADDKCTIGMGKEVPQGQEDMARAAVMSCPENALTLTD